MNRKFLFGKYKGKDIKYIILTHIGYIMWCLDNINHFSLNNEEQAVYDAVAIAVKKYKTVTPFPKEKLFAHVKNTDDFKNLWTPFVIKDGNLLTIRGGCMSFPACNYIKKYITSKVQPDDPVEILHILAHEMVKDLMLSDENRYSDD